LVGEGAAHRGQEPYPVDWDGGEAGLVDERCPDRIRRPTCGDQGSRFGASRENVPVDIVLIVYKIERSRCSNRFDGGLPGSVSGVEEARSVSMCGHGGSALGRPGVAASAAREPWTCDAAATSGGSGRDRRREGVT
jgi:hypothetical protein